MNDDAKPVSVAVVCEEDGEHATAMAAYLRSQNLTDVEWFAPRDVDDVDEAVCDRRVGRVVFVDLTALLDAIWDQEIQFDRWLSAGARVSFANPPGSTPTRAVEAAAIVEPIPAVVFESWRQWNRRHRRRQVVAGAILSGIALAAGFALIA